MLFIVKKGIVIEFENIPVYLQRFGFLDKSFIKKLKGNTV